MVSDPCAPLAWQAGDWQRLVSFQRSRRLPHALLLSGPAGTGKQHFSEAFARFMLCENPAEQACGRCKACLLTSRGTHPDLVEISPEEPGKPIRIDQIRALNQFMAGAAQQGGYRVIVITPPEEMNINAANALLKGLEEPGNDTLFLLVSHNPGRLMATIRSRCQVVTMAVPSADQALNWLSEQPDIGADAELALKLSGGAPLAALEFVRNRGAERRGVMLNGLKGCASGRLSAPDVAQQWQKEDPVTLLAWLHGFVSDLVRFKLTESEAGLNSIDARSLISKASARTSEEKLFALMDKIHEYRLQVLAKSNPNRQLMFEDLLIRWTGLFTRKDRRETS